MSDIGGVLCSEAVFGGVCAGVVGVYGWSGFGLVVFAGGSRPNWGSVGANREKGPFKAGREGRRLQSHNQSEGTVDGLTAASKAITLRRLRGRLTRKGEFWKL